MSWLGAKPLPHEKFEPWLSDALNFYKGFVSFEQLKELEMQARKKKLGRPVTKRALAVEAYEMWLVKKLSYWDIAIELCDCGEPHNWDCRERIRLQVLILKKVLRKHGFSLHRS